MAVALRLRESRPAAEIPARATAGAAKKPDHSPALPLGDNGLARRAPETAKRARGRYDLQVGGEVFALPVVPQANQARALLRAAELAQGEKNPFLALAPEARTAIAQRLQSYLLIDRYATRISETAVSLRSASSALLTHLAGAMRTREENAPLRASIDAMLTAAEVERHPALRRTMIANTTHLTDRRLLARERTRRDDLLGTVLHEAAPRDRWFKDDPNPVLNVVSNVMDEFWASELRSYREQGFKVVKQGEKEAIATKVRADDRGRDVTIRVVLRNNDTEIFDPVADKDVHVVIYTGHAQLGGVPKIALANAPRAKNADPVIALFACRGRQNLSSITERFPHAHVLVSDQGTYARDDRIVMHTLLDGIASGETYAQIQAKALRQKLWEKDNYFFPHETSRLSLDQVLPAVFDPRAKRIDRVVNAVNFFNTIHGYYAEAFGNRAEKALQDRFVSDGWFDGANKDEIVRLDDGDRIRVSINRAHQHEDVDALGMMAVFALAMKIGERTRPDEKLSERRLRSLAMVASYVYFLVEYSDVADALLAKFAKQFDFPPTLSYPVILRAVNADAHGDASPKVTRALERGMLYPFLEVNPDRVDPEFRSYIGKALERLRDSKTEIGAATFEAIATGRVLVDELSDLSLEDFKHARREYARDGIDLPLKDALRLRDGRVTSIRRLNDSIAGYAWDNRIYVARNMTPDALAATLVHEVNHVLNASEENYRGAKAVLLEEYRATYAEALYHGRKLDPAKCRAMKQKVIDDYALKGVTPADVPDLPPGTFVYR